MISNLFFIIFSFQKKKILFLFEDNLNYKEIQYNNFLSIIIHIITKCKVKYFNTFQ